MNLTQEIKAKFPNYKTEAKNDFNHPHDLWRKPMYQENPVFIQLKTKYGNNDGERVTTRKQIIDLYKSEKYYDAYLCTLVWGKIGSYQRGRDCFNTAFLTSKEDVENAIKRIKELLDNNNLHEAFSSMCKGQPNHLPGLGVSFFTKILYFVGATSKCTTKPLIFDTNSIRILKRLYNDDRVNQTPRQTFRHYLYFCNRMNKLCGKDALDLPSSGHLEAFLFNTGRELI